MKSNATQRTHVIDFVIDPTEFSYLPNAIKKSLSGSTQFLFLQNAKTLSSIGSKEFSLL